MFDGPLCHSYACVSELVDCKVSGDHTCLFDACECCWLREWYLDMEVRLWLRFERCWAWDWPTFRDPTPECAPFD
jgi:hypothetical protein